jgi:hypothetical protein
LKPPTTLEVIVVVPWPPWLILTEIGEADRLKLGAT